MFRWSTFSELECTYCASAHDVGYEEPCRVFRIIHGQRMQIYRNHDCFYHNVIQLQGCVPFYN